MLGSGHGVRSLLAEEAVPFVRELYLAITIDPSTGEALALACAQGGVDIEELALLVGMDVE